MELLRDWSHLDKKPRKKRKRTRKFGENPRAKGTNPRSKGTNPRSKKAAKAVAEELERQRKFLKEI